VTDTLERLPKAGHGMQPQAKEAHAGASVHLGYLAWLLAGLLGALAAFYFVLLALRATDNLPPPAFTNSLCVDEKLSFLREHPAHSPNLLVIGSSVAWRHFDSATVARIAPGIRPLNGGFCGLRANQAVFAANWLLDRQPTVEQVLMIVAPQDFAECRKNATAVFDRQDVDSFVYGSSASRWPYYMQYFSPGSLIGNARRVKDKRANLIELDPLVFTPFADGPLDTTTSQPTLSYDRPEALDSTCFSALKSLATRVQQEGRQLTVVTTPLHPDWKAEHDPGAEFLHDFEAKLLAVLKPTQAKFWNADKQWKTDRASFTDAIHLRWSAAQEFSAVLARLLASQRTSGAASGTRETIPLPGGVPGNGN
jgi:hypothetical protein